MPPPPKRKLNPGQALSKASVPGGKPSAPAERPKWTDIGTLVLAVFSILGNIYLWFAYQRASTELGNQKTRLESLELEQKLKASLILSYEQIRRENITTFVSPKAYADWDKASPMKYPEVIKKTPVFSNALRFYQEIGKEIEDDPFKQPAVFGGDQIHQVFHNLLVLRMRNVTANTATKVKLKCRVFTFPQAPSMPLDVETFAKHQGPKLWELAARTDSVEATVDVRDMLGKSDILIPLAHMAGTDHYFGQTYLPVELSYFDEGLQTEVRRPVEWVLPEDDWVLKQGVDGIIHIAQ